MDLCLVAMNGSFSKLHSDSWVVENLQLNPLNSKIADTLILQCFFIQYQLFILG